MHKSSGTIHLKGTTSLLGHLILNPEYIRLHYTLYYRN